MSAEEQVPEQDVIEKSWREPTLDEIAGKQGITSPQKFDDLLGAGKDLWADDTECEKFIDDIYQRRRDGNKEYKNP